MTHEAEPMMAASPSTPELFGFTKDEIVKEIELKQLSKSVRVEGKHGRTLSTRPVQSWIMIATILNYMDSRNVNYSLQPIWVQKKSSFPRINDNDKNLGYNREECPLAKWEFDKMITSIQIPNLGNDLATGTIALSFTDKGMTMALGMNVSVCSNFSILGGNVIRTFKQGGNEAINWESMKLIIDDWIRNREQLIGVEMEIMQRMIDRSIQDESVLDRVIGNLYKGAIAQSYQKGPEVPFDTHGMSQFTQEVLKQRKDRESIGNVWDLYNWGTEIMKPGRVDIADITESSRLYADYLCLEFGIEREDLTSDAVVVE